LTASAGADPAHLELELPSGPLPLGFARGPDSLYLVARDRAARWPTQVLRSGFARVRLNDRPTGGSARLVTDPEERSRILALFLARYGRPEFDRWYANPARVLEVVIDRPVELRAPEARYRAWLEAEFDNVARDYDRHITGNRINRLLRDRSLAELRRSFRQARRLLEVGCGSGMETLPLLREGHELVCVDISARMLDVVREKARAEGLQERLETVHIAAAELPQLVVRYGHGRFDGAYSTYGALNCEADLGPIVSSLADLLPPGAPFVAGVYNRFCVFELLGYGLTGQWRRATARTRHPIPVGTSRFCVDVFAFSTSEFRARFDPWFLVERLEGVPVLLPPSDLVNLTERWRNGFDRFARLDRTVAGRWPFRLLGDHFLMTLRRRPDAAR